jgi:tRNA(Arg) A34 adenosine deaminase TadA
MNQDQKFLEVAVNLAISSVKKGGGPFGAIIVRDGKIISRAVNRVVLSADPTAHAEVLAIRKAARKLKSHDLTGCILYSSCEPCPMCVGAVYWARISMVIYSASRVDAASAGFDDNTIYKEIRLDPESRKLTFRRIMSDRDGEAFRLWLKSESKVPY